MVAIPPSLTAWTAERLPRTAALPRRARPPEAQRLRWAERLRRLAPAQQVKPALGRLRILVGSIQGQALDVALASSQSVTTR